MAKKITLKNKNGDVLCPHTAIEQVQGLKEALDDKLGKTEVANSAKALGTSTYSGGDLNTFVPAVGKVEYYSIIPNTAANMPDPTGYQNSVMSFGLHDNGATAQMFFAKDKPLYYRSSQTGEWQQIASTKDVGKAFNYLGYNLDLNEFYDNENKSGTVYVNTPDGAGNITNAPDYYGGAVNFGAGVSNFQLFSPAYSNKLYHRNRWWSDGGGEWKEWKQLRTIDDKVTTSHIADAAITPAKIQTSIALNGTPSMTVEPTTSSPDKTIASVGLVKNLKIDTRNLLTNSKEITIDGSALTSGSKYITKKLPISVAVGDVLTFNCEDMIINAGTDQTHGILLYSGGALAAVKYISPTSKTATITVTKASSTPYLYMYAGYSDDSAGKSITYKGATLVKGDKPMLLWQRAEEDLDDVADYTVFPNLISASDLELGALTDADGQNTTTTNKARARSAGYIPVSAPKITLKSWTDGVVFYLWTYKADKTPIQMSYSTTGWISAKYTYTLPTGTAYIRLCIKKTSGAEFTLSELKTLKLKAENGSKATDWQPSAADMQVARPTVYYQSSQPVNAVNGDIWIVS